MTSSITLSITSTTTLDKYIKVTKAIENVQEMINSHTDIIKAKLENTINSNEQNMYLEEYRMFISNIKNDPQIIPNYKRLKQKQKELEDTLLSLSRKNPDAVEHPVKLPVADSIITETNTDTKNEHSTDSTTDSSDADSIMDNDVDKILHDLRLKYVEMAFHSQ